MSNQVIRRNRKNFTQPNMFVCGLQDNVLLLCLPLVNNLYYSGWFAISIGGYYIIDLQTIVAGNVVCFGDDIHIGNVYVEYVFAKTHKCDNCGGQHSAAWEFNSIYIVTKPSSITNIIINYNNFMWKGE